MLAAGVDMTNAHWLKMATKLEKVNSDYTVVNYTVTM